MLPPIPSHSWHPVLLGANPDEKPFWGVKYAFMPENKVQAFYELEGMNTTLEDFVQDRTTKLATACLSCSSWPIPGGPACWIMLPIHAALVALATQIQRVMQVPHATSRYPLCRGRN